MSHKLNALFSLALFSAAFNAMAASPSDLPEITLYKDAYCGCCTEYVKYLQDQGIVVKAIDHPDMSLIKKQLGSSKVPSCHTMKVGKYTVEGHVPMASLLKMWEEQPDIKGIALPGMPATSPGMGKAKEGSLKIMTIEHDEAVNHVFNIE